MTDRVKIKNFKNLSRDTRSKAIINTDSKALKEAKQRKMLLQKKQSQIEIMQLEHEKLKSEISEIKSTMKLILEKLSK